MAVIVKLKQEHVDTMVEHALEDAPVECCGILAARAGAVVSIHRMKNTEKSPYRFNIHPLEYKRLSDALEEDGLEVAGFYHSHTGSEARPSPTDIRAMGPFFGPPIVHFVLGVADHEKPHARVWYIEGTTTHEHEYELID